MTSINAIRSCLFSLLVGLPLLPACSGGNDDDDDGLTVNDDDVVPADDDDDDLTDDDDDPLPGPFVQNLHLVYLGDPAREMGVMWKNSYDMPDAVLEYGESADNLDRKSGPEVENFEGIYVNEMAQAESRPTYVFKCRLAGLEPESAYFYRVTDGRRSTPVYEFSTAADKGARQPITFAVFGDNRGFLAGIPSPDYPTLLKQVAKLPLDFVVNTGDMTLDSQQSEWDDYYKAGEGLMEDMPWLVTKGNHDNRVPESFLRNNLLPNEGEGLAYYSADIANIHFVSLDTDDPSLTDPAASEQVAWLREDLASTDQDWIIAFFHKSVYNSSENHGSIGSLQKAFVPTFNEFGVDVAYMGHDHMYDRTHFLYGLTEFTPENALPVGGGTRAAEICPNDCARGTLYVTSGGAGAGLYKILDPVLPHTAVALRKYHFVKVEIDGDLYRQTAIDTEGNVIDTFEFIRFNQH